MFENRSSMCVDSDFGVGIAHLSLQYLSVMPRSFGIPCFVCGCGLRILMATNSSGSAVGKRYSCILSINRFQVFRAAEAFGDWFMGIIRHVRQEKFL